MHTHNDNVIHHSLGHAGAIAMAMNGNDDGRKTKT